MSNKNLAKRCLAFSGLFEAELLIELMLRFWNHPLSDDQDYRNELLENAVEVLRASAKGQRFMEDMPPNKMNFVSAVWYAEWNGLDASLEKRMRLRRKQWLERIRRSLPSCFCDPKDLP
ncbi:MAG: hypothetical protein L0Y72_21275 [Gemmataceae bacterium]|nr:hypothetical protein [Gemmataceae bacterium]MCI0741575.1 hypothetical protein [Gemmataceae bacterium]